MVNILAFHLFLAPAGIVPGLLVGLLNAYLLLAHREVFAPLLQAQRTSGKPATVLRGQAMTA